MLFFLSFTPILLFVTIFVGSGVYYSAMGVDHAFYQISPISAILPAISSAWLINRGTTKQKMDDFLEGIRHKDIITMCIIFLLAGGFSQITKNIGSVDATVNFALSLVPSKYLLIGLFFVAAFISTSIGTSMGTIATIAPIAASLSEVAGFDKSLGVATVVGGAMFGDNLSIISDTTIAAVMSQEADMREKLKLNAKVAIIASIFTIIILLFKTEAKVDIASKPYNFTLLVPYLCLISLALKGVNVFISLTVSILIAGIIGLIAKADYSLLVLSKNISDGFGSMSDIMILSLLVGGLSGLIGKRFSQQLADKLSAWITTSNACRRMSQMVIAKLVSIFDIMLANNTIAIIFSGEIAREIAKKHKIPAHYSASWLDIFSCVFQGVIPYGAQILLASTIAGVSPLMVVPYVYYCYILGAVALIHIMIF